MTSTLNYCSYNRPNQLKTFLNLPMLIQGILYAVRDVLLIGAHERVHVNIQVSASDGRLDGNAFQSSLLRVHFVGACLTHTFPILESSLR